MSMDEEELRQKLLEMKMRPQWFKWTKPLKLLVMVVEYIPHWSEEELKILRAWINFELERRKDLRKHFIETLHR